MSDVQPLIGLLEVLLHLSYSKPRVKPGGYGSEIFLDLTEEEREAFECSICYLILKDPQKCKNNHNYCDSCIFTWRTSSLRENHQRCPVCRIDGIYTKNNDLDDKIGKKRVKCLLKSCNWKGPLKFLGGHRHTTYTKTGLPYRPTSRVHAEEDLPSLTNSPSLTGADKRISSISTVQNSPRLANSIARHNNANRTNGNTSRNGNNSLIESSPFTPRPPSSSRPPGQPTRRMPNLPSIVNQGQRGGQQGRTIVRRNVGTNSQSNNNRGQVSIRDRLRESRIRLDEMMTNFASELERGRRDIADFQQERERRRQEQLREVRELGRRLGHVAQELRGLLERRRQMSSSDSSDGDDF